MKAHLIILVLGLLITVSSCSVDQSEASIATITQDSDVGNVQDISAKSLKEKIEAGNGIILDVRTPGEIASGHIEGASFIDFYDNEFMQKVGLMDKSKSIYVYCRSGGRSSKAAEKLLKLGFHEVYNVLGGIGAWNAEGYPLIAKSNTTDLNIETLSIGDFEKILESPLPVLVDFHTQWCAPCKKMAPIVDKLRKEFEDKAIVLRVDADQSKSLAAEYKVTGVPVFIIFKNGQPQWRNTGLMREDDLRKEINNTITVN